MKLTNNMTGMKIRGNRYYVSVNEGDKVVDGEVFADGRDVVVEKKVVSGERWVEVTKGELVAIVTEAKELGIVCEPWESAPDVEARHFDWSKAKTQEEIIAELKEENARLEAENKALAVEVEEWEAMGVTPKTHMDALEELGDEIAQLKSELLLAKGSVVGFIRNAHGMRVPTDYEVAVHETHSVHIKRKSGKWVVLKTVNRRPEQYMFDNARFDSAIDAAKRYVSEVA